MSSKLKLKVKEKNEENEKSLKKRKFFIVTQIESRIKVEINNERSQRWSLKGKKPPWILKINHRDHQKVALTFELIANWISRHCPRFKSGEKWRRIIIKFWVKFIGSFMCVDDYCFFSVGKTLKKKKELKSFRWNEQKFTHKQIAKERKCCVKNVCFLWFFHKRSSDMRYNIFPSTWAHRSLTLKLPLSDFLSAVNEEFLRIIRVN